MTTPRLPSRVGRRFRGGMVVACVGALLAFAAATVSSQASRPAASSPAIAPAARSEDGVRWRDLSPQQRETLAPLEHEWSTIDGPRKQKWLTLAGRFRSLSPDERTRISARMSDWARLTPAERGQARMRFEEVRQVPAPDRNARWEAYQALPADARQKFAARAASAAGSSPAQRPSRPPRDTREAKVNVVPSATPVQPPKQVAPALVQAGPGATTTLITRRPAPPSHQQTGMPKIAATPEFVNRSTLLPRRGPQAAAVSQASPPGLAGVPGVTISPPIIVPAPPAAARPTPAAASQQPQ